MLLRELVEKHDLPVVVLYLAGVLGVGDLQDSGRYIKNILHRRMPVRVEIDAPITYVYVRDFAEAILLALEKGSNIGEAYIIGKHWLSFRELNELLSEVASVPLPILKLPESLLLPVAKLLTLVADIINKPPLFEMSADSARTVMEGTRAKGTKAEGELGSIYTPLEEVLREIVESYRESDE